LFPSSSDVSVAVGGLLDGGVPEAKSEFCKQRVGGWLRYEASPTPHTSIKAFLPAVVTRISIDVLRSARFRREKLKSRSLTAPALYMPTRFPRISPLKLSEKGLGRVGADAASISSVGA
jgi:hypothetical protein